MTSWWKRFKKHFRTADQKRQDFGAAARRFQEENPGSFVLLANPDTDEIYAAYDGIESALLLSRPDYKKVRFMRQALTYKWESDEVHDRFLYLVDSMLFNIASEADNRRSGKFGTRKTAFAVGEPEVTMEGIKSPLQPDSLK